MLSLPIQAYDQTGSEMLIRATPYDQKLMVAGMLMPEYSIGLSPAEPSGRMEQYFMEARSFRYSKDKHGDLWQSPMETESRKSGDCEDKSVWLYSSLKRAGYKDVRLVIGRFRRSDRGFHSWVTVRGAEGTLWVLDPATQKRIWKAGDFSADFYFPLFSFDGVSKYRHTRSA